MKCTMKLCKNKPWPLSIYNGISVNVAFGGMEHMLGALLKEESSYESLGANI